MGCNPSIIFGNQKHHNRFNKQTSHYVGFFLAILS